MVIIIDCLMKDILFSSYDEAIKIDPKYKEVWNNKGKLLKH